MRVWNTPSPTAFSKNKLRRYLSNSIKACASWGQVDVCAAEPIAGVVDDSDAAVWFVCSGWGSASIVHATEMTGGKDTQLAHRGIHSRRCDRWDSRAQSFFGSGRFVKKFSAWSAGGSGW